MKSINLVVLAVLIGLASCEKNTSSEDVRTYILDANGKLAISENYFLGKDTSKVAGYYYAQDIVLDPFIVAHSFSSWGFGEGFTYSNCTDTENPYYTNLSAIPAKGAKGDTYFIASANGFSTSAQISFKEGKEFNAVECFVTNATYAYLAMKNGNDFARKFEDSDWFKLTITGLNGQTETGKIDFMLAEGRNLVDNWQNVNLRQLGKVTSIIFTLTSTDNGDWGMNTPSYFCLDQLTVSE